MVWRKKYAPGKRKKGHILERISIGMQKGRRKKTEEKQRKY